MKITTWMLMAGTLGLFGTTLAGGQKWDVPYWNNTQGNPYTNADGVVWSVHGATSNIGYRGDPTPWSLYAAPTGLMTWHAANGRWEGQVAGSAGTRPYRSTAGLVSGRSWDSLNFPAALMARVPKSGTYAVYGTMKVLQLTDGGRDFRIGYYSEAGNAWHPLYNYAAPALTGVGNTTTNLTPIAALQKVKLVEGDRIAFIISAYDWYFTPTLDFTGSGDPVGIAWIPPGGTVISIL